MKKILATLISVITMTIVASAATPSESTYSQSAKVGTVVKCPIITQRID